MFSSLTKVPLPYIDPLPFTEYLSFSIPSPTLFAAVVEKHCMRNSTYYAPTKAIFQSSVHEWTIYHVCIPILCTPISIDVGDGGLWKVSLGIGGGERSILSSRSSRFLCFIAACVGELDTCVSGVR